MKQFHLFEACHADAMYFLGAMATDGNVSGNRPKLDQADEAWLLKIQKRLWPEATVTMAAEEIWALKSPDGEVLRTSEDRRHLEDLQAMTAPGSEICRVRQALYTLRRHEDELVTWLAQYGVVPNKSLTLTFPKNLPPDRIRDFIQGVIDGDGSIWIHNCRQEKGGEVYTYQYPCIGVYSGSRGFVEDLQRVIESQVGGNLSSTIVEKESGGTDTVPQKGVVYVLRIGNWSAYRVLRWLYGNPNHLCLQRKRDVANRIFALYADSGKRDVDAVKEEIAEACELRQLKMSYGMIAQFMGITRERVKNHCKLLPPIEATQFLPGRRTAPALIAECRELREKGWSLYLISDEVGVHPATVFDNVKDIVVKTRFTRLGDEEERKAGIDRILELGRMGWSEAMIVAETGFSKDKVRKWLATITDRVRSQGLRKEMTPELIARIEALYEEGKKQKEIAKEIDRAEPTVKKYIAAYRKRKASQGGDGE